MYHIHVASKMEYYKANKPTLNISYSQEENSTRPHLVVSICSWGVSALGGIVLAATQGHLTVGHRLGGRGWGTTWGPHLTALYTWVTATVTIVVETLALQVENKF